MYVGKSKTHKVGFVVSLEFILTQHTPFGVRLMQDIISFLGCGKYYPHSVREAGSIWCRSFKDIEAKIIPLFMKYPIKGTKAQDFLNWCEIAEIIKAGDHHNKEGIAKIKEIQANMNRSRDFGVILEANAFGPLLEVISVIGGVYVRSLTRITPGSLNLLSETSRDKPINSSDFEMNREVQHVDKGSKSLNYKDFRAKVILTHAKFNLQVNYAPVKSEIVYTILQKISLKSILRYIVSFCIPKAICLLMEFAKSKIRDVILGTEDLLRKVISKISFRLISAALLGFVGRRSFHSINYNGR